MNRFKMSFSNSQNLTPKFLGVNNYTPKNPVIRPSALNTPMIERVYKAKPGCSACGKKVA
jgi:hypothetical protein